MNREKRTYSGKLLDVDFYPVFSDGRRMPSRKPKTKPSTAEQEKYNRNKAVREFCRIVNANFDEKDYFMHPTFTPISAPQSREEAKKILANYRARVQRRRKKELKKAKLALSVLPERKELKEQRKELIEKINVLSRPFKYAYTIEEVTYKTGLLKGRTNYHYHLFITGGLDDRLMERMWDKGVRVNVNNYQPERFGPETAAKYMLKSTPEAGKKKYICSRNMTPPRVPDPSRRDGRTSNRQLEKWAKVRVNDAEFWERKYKGYRFERCFARKNPYNGHWYISIIMYRATEEMPPWTLDDWGVYE